MNRTSQQLVEVWEANTVPRVGVWKMLVKAAESGEGGDSQQNLSLDARSGNNFRKLLQLLNLVIVPHNEVFIRPEGEGISLIARGKGEGF